ncbi:DEAD/DEAH box helicase [Phycisphaera mikurensis]|uniref:DEAD/DEAH box helicase n=1 Tax=Phycisphaera mikurensis TaxID=547188 RepID=UPI00059C7FE6|nr:DEAD/DEAH box helicase [Phycisphaera mikurensis]MBB6441221.1 ATP-dependent RNA helicase RhlE [Phycisphaera mikurensis]
MRFDDFALSPALLRNVAEAGYQTPSPIQAEAIPHVLGGRDVLGCAQTGTGKTAAFALPIIHRITSAERHGGKRTRCLVLCPTRELAVQIADGFLGYARGMDLSGALVFGGVGPNPQIAKLKRGAEVVVATPGRLLDLMNQGFADLSAVETLVLDEADRMLDMGFIHDIRRIVKELPGKRQTLLFSATVPTEIRTLARKLLHDPVTITIEPDAPAAEKVDQSVRFVEHGGKADLLAGLIRGSAGVAKPGEAGANGMHRTIVFTRTKHGADKLVKALKKHGIQSEAIHGNKSQNARQRALENFRGTKTPVLVATDVAARGIDVDGITHVVNYDLTHEPETYVHRIGRTARAGADGHAVSLCDREELAWLRAIEQLLGRRIAVEGEAPDWSFQRPGPPPKQGGNRGGGPRGSQAPRGGGGSGGGRGPAARGGKGGGGRRKPGGGRRGGSGAGPRKGGRPGRGAG